MHEATGEFAKARNTDMVEDLGMVEYVFSDKTGTLTSNEMQLRCIALRGTPFGSSEFRCARSAILLLDIHQACSPIFAVHCLLYCNPAAMPVGLMVQLDILSFRIGLLCKSFSDFRPATFK